MRMQVGIGGAALENFLSKIWCKVDPISLEEEGFAFRFLNIKYQLPPFQVNKQTRKHPKNIRRNCDQSNSIVKGVLFKIP